MAAKSRRPRIGDVLEVAVGTGFAYLQFLGTHREYGDAILVAPKVSTAPPEVAASLFEDAYITFYPVRLAASRQLVRTVGTLPAPPLPSRLRRPGARLGSRVETWIIEDQIGETLRRQLSDSELSLPIAAIWNHEYLVQRISEGWHPEQEGAASKS